MAWGGSGDLEGMETFKTDVENETERELRMHKSWSIPEGPSEIRNNEFVVALTYNLCDFL